MLQKIADTMFKDLYEPTRLSLCQQISIMQTLVEKYKAIIMQRNC